MVLLTMLPRVEAVCIEAGSPPLEVEFILTAIEISGKSLGVLLFRKGGRLVGFGWCAMMRLFIQGSK